MTDQAMHDTIWQLFRNGPTADGNMVGKRQRDEAAKAGLIDRAQGWNWLTYSGVTLALELGMGRDTEKGGSPTEDERLVCEEAYRRILALATPEALAASPEVQALIAAAEARGMDRAAEIAESIRTRITNGPMPEGARFDYEQAIRAEADAIRALAPTDALAELQALRDERDRLDAVTNTLSEMWEGEQTARHSAEAELAATQAKLARLATYEAFTTDGWGFSHPEITARVQYARAALEGAKP